MAVEEEEEEEEERWASSTTSCSRCRFWTDDADRERGTWCWGCKDIENGSAML